MAALQNITITSSYRMLRDSDKTVASAQVAEVNNNHEFVDILRFSLYSWKLDPAIFDF